MKKLVCKVNTNAEKTIIAMTASVVLAIIFDGKRKKPEKRKSFTKRVSKHYKTINDLMLMTVARDVKKNEEMRAKQKEKNSYKTKLRDLEIQDAEYIEL